MLLVSFLLGNDYCKITEEKIFHHQNISMCDPGQIDNRDNIPISLNQNLSERFLAWSI